jgi:5-(carboxyamino)imidazole ribonucleotide mutase
VKPITDVLVVFGSASDSVIFEKILQILKTKNVSFEMRICSAHRTPKMLEQILEKTKAKLIIAGAGLSAALPGVVASQTTKPVIGIPCSGNYDGLDALLSVQQMPPGIPVLGAGVNAAEQAAELAEKILQEKKSVAIIKRQTSEEIEKRVLAAKEIFQKFDIVATEAAAASNDDTIYLEFFDLNETTSLSTNEKCVIFVPCAKANPANATLKLLELSKQGAWVGLGRGENAAIAAIEILNIHSSAFSEKLLLHRKEMQAKIIEADETEQKKLR